MGVRVGLGRELGLGWGGVRSGVRVRARLGWGWVGVRIRERVWNAGRGEELIRREKNSKMNP